MPVYVRRNMVSEIETIKKKEKEAMEDGGSSSGTASREELGKAMEKLQKQSDADEPQKEAIRQTRSSSKEEGVSSKGKRKSPRQQPQESPSRRSPDVRKNVSHGKGENGNGPKNPPKNQGEGEDPAKAEDLNKLIDKLKSDANS